MPIKQHEAELAKDKCKSHRMWTDGIWQVYAYLAVEVSKIDIVAIDVLCLQLVEVAVLTFSLARARKKA